MLWMIGGRRALGYGSFNVNYLISSLSRPAQNHSPNVNAGCHVCQVYQYSEAIRIGTAVVADLYQNHVVISGGEVFWVCPELGRQASR